MVKVIKLAQPGYDVKTAGDENLIFNSNWPLLKIYKQGSFQTSDGNTANQLVIEHNLGYVPAFWYFANNRGDVVEGTPESRSEFRGPIQFFPTITDKKLMYDINPGFFSGVDTFYYYIFALDILKAYTAPTIKIGGQQQGGESSKLFKVAKENKNITSTALEDFSINSKARSPLIHAVFPVEIKGAETATYYHNLGYTPMILAYASVGVDFGSNTPTSGGYMMLYLTGGLTGIRIDKEKVQVSNSAPTTHKYSIIILKDPFETDHKVNVAV